MVGNVVSSCSLSMTATNCFGLCAKTLPLKAAWEPRVFWPHFVHDIKTVVSLPELVLIGLRREPQSAQNSICFILQKYPLFGFAYPLWVTIF